MEHQRHLLSVQCRHSHKLMAEIHLSELTYFRIDSGVRKIMLALCYMGSLIYFCWSKYQGYYNIAVHYRHHQMLFFFKTNSSTPHRQSLNSHSKYNINHIHVTRLGISKL